MRFALPAVPMKGLPRRRTLKCLAISAFAWLIATSTACATTFVRMDEADLRARSVAAVVGGVTRIEAAEDPSTGGVDTYVHIEPEAVLFGDLPAGELVLRETGGRLPGRVEWIFGSPQYAVGERVLAFLSQNPDGTLRTTGMAMGKYTIHASSSGASLATRDLGDGVSVLDPASGRWQMGGAPETRRLARWRRGCARRRRRRARLGRWSPCRPSSRRRCCGRRPTRSRIWAIRRAGSSPTATCRCRSRWTCMATTPWVRPCRAPPRTKLLRRGPRYRRRAWSCGTPG